MTYTPGHVSEFPDVSIVADCVPSSGVMLVNKMTHGRYPSSVAEREALQNAMGTQDEGANNTQLAAGIAKRYGIKLTPGSGWTTIASILTKPNMAVAVIGQYQKLPAYIRNQGNQPSFDGMHEIYLQADGLGTVTVGDPLASRMIFGIPIGDLQAYCNSAGASYLPVTEQTATLVGYRLLIPRAGTWTFYHVMRFTHALYGAKSVGFSRASWAPVAHGSPGFWMITAGTLTGYYAVYGKTQAFTIVAVYSDGSLKPVPSNA